MVCAKCGATIAEGLSVCPECGTATNAAPSGMMIPIPVAPTVTVVEDSKKAKKEKKPKEPKPAKEPKPKKEKEPKEPKPKKEKAPKEPKPVKEKNGKRGALIAWIVILFLVLAGLLGYDAYLIITPKPLDITQYVVFTYAGGDGFGTVEAKLDTAAVKEYIHKNIMKRSFYDEEKVSKVLSGVQVKVSPVGQVLSNGDKVTATISYDNELAKTIHTRFEGTEAFDSVKNLTNVEGEDAFADLEVWFEGDNGHGKIELGRLAGDKFADDILYEFDKYENLSNGDIVTITLVYDEAALAAKGYVIAQKSKQYTVSNLKESMSSVSDLSKNEMADLKERASAALIMYLDSGVSVSAEWMPEYVGYVYDNAAPDEMIFVFSSNLKDAEGTFQKTLYFAVRITGISLNDSGVYTKGDAIVTGIDVWNPWNLNAGYYDPYKFYDELVQEGCIAGDGFQMYQDVPEIVTIDQISEEMQHEIVEDAAARVMQYLDEYFAEEITFEPGEDMGMMFAILVREEDAPYVAEEANALYVIQSVSFFDGKKTQDRYLLVEYKGVTTLPNGDFFSTDEPCVVNDMYISGYPDMKSLIQDFKDSVENEILTLEITESLKTYFR